MSIFSRVAEYAARLKLYDITDEPIPVTKSEARELEKYFERLARPAERRKVHSADPKRIVIDERAFMFGFQVKVL